jgi:hypothetical protein
VKVALHSIEDTAVFGHLKLYPIKFLLLQVVYRKRDRHKIDCVYQ